MCSTTRSTESRRGSARGPKRLGSLGTTRSSCASTCRSSQAGLTRAFGPSFAHFRTKSANNSRRTCARSPKGGDSTKVINLIKSIEKTAEENSEDPFLIALAERAKTVQESYEDRQTATSEALDELLKAVQQDVQRRRQQAARGLDGLSYFVLCKLNDEGVKNADVVCKKVREAFVQFPSWRRSQNELREVRQKVTFAIFAEEDDLDKVSALVDSIFSVLQRTGDA